MCEAKLQLKSDCWKLTESADGQRISGFGLTRSFATCFLQENISNTELKPSVVTVVHEENKRISQPVFQVLILKGYMFGIQEVIPTPSVRLVSSF